MQEDPTEPPGDDTTEPQRSEVRERVIPAAALRNVLIEPRLALAKRTFGALVASAAEPPLRLLAEFDVAGVGRLRTTVLSGFSLVDNPGESAGSITLSFDHRGRDPVRYVCNSEQALRVVNRKLIDHGLVVHSVSSATTQKLTIDPVVPAAITLTVDRRRAHVRVNLRNIIMLGSTDYTIPIEALDRTLIDAMVQLVVHQDRTFYRLMANIGRH